MEQSKIIDTLETYQQCSTQVEPSPTQDPHASEEQGEGPQPNEQDQGQDQPQDGG